MDHERIGKYQILGELGRGTMGEVHKAFDPVLKRHVALKTVSVRLEPDGEALQRFQREAQAAALLNHPNIVTVHDFGQEQGILYMAMELLEGSDLREAIDKDLLGSLEHRLGIMDGILRALEYAHSRGVVHRDIKPANVYLRNDGSVKITDFGLARLNTSEMTQEGIVLGTPSYMSPEQALGDRVDGRTDLFSAGAVLYELLTAHKPFEADSTPSVLFQVVHRPPPPVRRWAPDVPAGLVEVVNRSLSKAREQRYASAAEMSDALDAARRGVHAPRRLKPPILPPSGSRRSPTLPAPALPPAPRGARGSSSGAMRGTARRRDGSVLAWPAAGAALALVVLLVLAGPPVLRRVLPPARPGGDAEVGALTQALVATQVQLAHRELDDKNWEAARTQAQDAVRLVPGHVEASRILETARARLAERDAAVANAGRALGTGQTSAAAEQLSLLLELDPGHPAAAGLSARLNAVFRTQAADAAAATREARERAVAAGAAGSPEFARAEAASRGAASLVTTAEYADATRTFLGARDAFDRAGRTARARRAKTAAAAAIPASAKVPPPPGATDANEARAARPPAPVPEATPLPPPPRFIAGRTTVTTPAAGEPAGFETADVRTRKPPRFEGRMEFEVRPPEVRPGEPFAVRVQLVNEGPRDVRIQALEITTVEDGQRTTGPARLLQRQVAPRGRALVAEHSGVWSAGRSWTLEAVAAVEGGESVRSHLQAE